LSLQTLPKIEAEKKRVAVLFSLKEPQYKIEVDCKVAKKSVKIPEEGNQKL